MARDFVALEVHKLLNLGCSVTIVGLPGWGISRFLREHSWGEDSIYVDAKGEGLGDLNDLGDEGVIVIDHFEVFLKNKDIAWFEKLRFWRDEKKYKRKFLLGMNSIIANEVLVKKTGSFFEIASENVFYLPVCNRVETQVVGEFWVDKKGLDRRLIDWEDIYDLSGGIPSLIKTYVAPEIDYDRVDALCLRIWEALDEEMKGDLLKGRINTKHVKLGLIGDLGKLVGRDFCKWLERYTLNSQQMDGYLDRLLTKTESQIWDYLENNMERVISREELMRAGWPGMDISGVSDMALDQVISRLRRKVEVFGFVIVTIKGRGYLSKRVG